MINFLLFVVAFLLIWPLTLINAIVVWRKGYFRDTALSIDIFANREYRATWNKFLKIESGYKFGVTGETISSALGKNQRDNTLTKMGRALCGLLDTLDKDHCIKSIN